MVGTFKVPNDCKHFTVSLVVYTLENGDFRQRAGNQHIFSSMTKKVQPGKNVFVARMPNCGWQADLAMGQPVNLFNGGKPNPNIEAKVGNLGQACHKPNPTPAPTPTPTGTTSQTEAF